ncbi:unnamed protein product [Candida verbasci]|uniref:Sodium/calcium exchanger membrane region domain-containing protein n=1 Tax=Candida verbasci TaxID=1227364 RepID=A0A9W4TQQ7_9ASCO|nr:unnamed protein product [Candida verbasci]
MFTIIIGLICLIIGKIEIRPPNLILIDLIWVLVVLSLFFYILSDGKITIVECGIMCGMYLIYILFLNLYDKEKEKLKVLDQEIIIEHCEDEEIVPKPRRTHDEREHEHLYNIEDALNVLSNDELVSYGSISRSPSPSLKQLSPSVSINEEENEPGKPLTILNLIEIFFNFIDVAFLLLIPVYEENSYLNKYHQMLVVWFNVGIPILLNYQFFQFPLVKLLPFILISTVLYQFIIKYYLPRNFKIISVSLIGIVASLILISNISILILQILKNLGFLWKISDYLLGLLIFAISNSINDLITNITLSTKINPILGINSCLGTPLLIILLGIGLNGLIVLLVNCQSEIKFNLTSNLIIDTMSLILTIILIIIYLLFNSWRFDKKIGAFLIIWYLAITGVNLYLK